MNTEEIRPSDEGLRTATASASVSASVEASGVQVFQFVGLMWATEYNARAAGLDNGFNAQTINAMNTLLMAYAALQALVLETALVMYPELYGPKKFRYAGIQEQFERFLKADSREGERLPDVILEISEHRRALTHSEPDNVRSAVLGKVISATDAARFAKEIRNVAEWLWQGRRPATVAAAFDQPNCFFEDKQQRT